MMLFKAKQVARGELERLSQETGVSLDDARNRIARSRKLRSSLHLPHHVYAGTAANAFHEAVRA